MARRRSGRQRQRPRQYSPRILVACEGEKTEYEYIARLGQRYKRRDGPCLVPLNVRSSDPEKVVEAVAKRVETETETRTFDRRMGDGAYVLLDVEPHDPSKHARLDRAIALAEEGKIMVLLSNPSFEFWLLCHFADISTACRSMAAPSAVDKVIQQCGGYGKAALHKNPRLFDKVLARVEHAVEVARHVHENHHQGATDLRTANPATSVYKLVAQFFPE